MINLMVLHWGIVKKQIDVFGSDVFSGNIEPTPDSGRIIEAIGKGRIRALTGHGGQKSLMGRGGND